jgi:hypothetical protein
MWVVGEDGVMSGGDIFRGRGGWIHSCVLRIGRRCRRFRLKRRRRRLELFGRHIGIVLRDQLLHQRWIGILLECCQRRRCLVCGDLVMRAFIVMLRKLL